MIRNALALVERIHDIHATIRDTVVAACEQSALEQLSEIVAEEAGDTIFAIDRISETVLLEHFATLAQEWSCVLVAEGLGETGVLVLPEGTSAADAELRVIVDPIDGTRGIMYQKRSAWILTGIAPNRGDATSLADIELAVQTEIPLVKQHLSDSFWVVAGQGAQGERLNRLNGERQPLVPRPSRATTIAQGYGSVARFFPGPRAVLATIDDELIVRTLGTPPPGKALAFEDQYISTGGQFSELMMGHDRWIADLRPLVTAPVELNGELRRPLCCHPYDLCTELIARAMGIIITDEHGQPLQAPLDVETDVAWIGYANQAIHDQIAQPLRTILQEQGLL